MGSHRVSHFCFKFSKSKSKKMEWLFGRRMTPDEMLRKNQRALTKAMRELDRERAKMEQQEKKIIADIKKMAKQGQMDAVKIMAKDLVRTRRYVKKFMLMRANIQAVSLKIQTLKSQSAMAQAMKGVTKAMGNMNKQMKMPEIQKIMMEFEKQSEIMDMKGEMMEDAIDDVMGELGLQLNDKLGDMPVAAGSLATAGAAKNKTAVAAGGADDDDADLQARLDDLRRD